MTALTAGRNTPQIAGDIRNGLLAASTTVFAGSLLMRNAAGFVVKGATATGLVGIGRAEDAGDNSTGSAGDAAVLYRPGVFRFANSAGADEITVAEIGDVVFAVDDQTVAKTDATASRSPAGFVDDVDALGVWVRFDEVLTKIATA